MGWPPGIVRVQNCSINFEIASRLNQAKLLKLEVKY
jgi:hypothetical protein